MPILALNQFGQIYETSPDREDGLGYGRSPEVVDQSDLTLGAAYLKAQNERRNSQIHRHHAQKLQDQMDMHHRVMRQRQMGAMHAMEQRHNKMMEHPVMKQEMIKRAAMQGCACEYKSKLTGNVMTANGMDGWAGMNRDQQAIHHALTGQGNNVAFALDPVEAHQASMKQHLNRTLRGKAR